MAPTTLSNQPTVVPQPVEPAAPLRSAPRVPDLGPGLVVLAGLVLLGALALAPFFPRDVVPASAPAGSFSAERALPHLQAIAAEPHPVGSPANQGVRDYLVAQAAALGLQPQVQRTEVFGAPTGDAAVLENVLVRLPGSAPTGAVLLVAHYDSTVNGPGAGDDGMAVAAMVETLRAIAAGPSLRNDLVFLFDDGEEPGMFGAQAFAEQHPWAADVRIALDFDADSPTGPTTLLWSTTRDGWLLDQVARSGSGLLAGPIENRAWRQEFHHDLHVLAAGGYSGLHFDRVGGSTMYHTQRDSLANVDMAALQHQGTVMLALARRFGDVPLEPAQTDDATLVAGFGQPLVSYPLGWTIPLLLVVGLAFVAVVGFGLRRGRLAWQGLAGAAITLVGGAGLLALIAQVAWEAAVATRPESRFFSERGFYGQGWYLAGTYALVAALLLGWWPWLVRRIGASHLLAAGIGGMLLLGLGFAISEPKIAYQATWPALFGALVLTCLVRAPERSGHIQTWRYVAVLLAAAVPVVGFLAGPLFEPTSGGLAEGPALLVAAAVLMAALLAPQLALAMTVGGRWLPTAAAVAGVAFLGVGVASSGVSPARPRLDTLAYGLDPERGEAYWMTVDPSPDEWTGQFLAGGTRRTLDELVGTTEPIPVLAAPALAVTLPPPSLAVLGQAQAGDVRTLWLHLASPREAGRLHLFGGPGTEIVAANLADAPPAPIEGNEVLVSGLPAEGIDLVVDVRASGPATFTVIDRSTGLPGLPGLPPRPATVMSAPVGEDLSGYPTLVTRSFAVSPSD